MNDIRDQFVLGVDIGGTHLRMGVVTRDHQIHHFILEEIKKLYLDGDPVKNLIGIIKSYLSQIQGQLVAVSIGFPSIVSKDKKVLYSTPNLDGFDNINIVDILNEAFNVPIFIDNDVNYLLLSEIRNRKLVNSGVVLGFYIGTGFGNSIYINNDFYSGKNGVAAELGHIPVLNGSGTCSCGNPGCIELYASGKRLQEIRDRYFPDVDLKDIFVKHKDDAIIQEFLNALSIPIATEINILDPDYVIIGGGVVQMDQFPKEDLEKYILIHTRKPYPANGLNIIYAQANQMAGVLGAAYYAWDKLGQNLM